MPSLLSLVSVIVLMLFSFLAGVKYCNTVKDQSSWMFETSEEIALPSSQEQYRQNNSNQSNAQAKEEIPDEDKKVEKPDDQLENSNNKDPNLNQANKSSE